jgi:hypothetical protein
MMGFIYLIEKHAKEERGYDGVNALRWNLKVQLFVAQ